MAPPLTPPYTGPFKVLRRALHTFQVQVGNCTETISTHRLKLCVSSPDTNAAEPPHQERPPHVQPGAKSPYQNPGEKTASKNQAEADRGVKSKKCPQSVKTNRKNPRFRAPLSSSAPSDVSLTPPPPPPHRRWAAPWAFLTPPVPTGWRNPQEKLRTMLMLVPDIRFRPPAPRPLYTGLARHQRRSPELAAWGRAVGRLSKGDLHPHLSSHLQFKCCNFIQTQLSK